MERPNRKVNQGFLDRTFGLTRRGSDIRTEVVAGITTFMTMAYIIFVNPSILSQTGMPFNSVLLATIASAAVGTILMAWLANYPFALAPGIGLSVYFTAIVAGRPDVTWHTALGAVFISGVAFLLLTVTKVRQMIIDAIPLSIRSAITAGIGLFITFIGLKNAGISGDPANFVESLRDRETILAVLGLFLTAGFIARGIKGSILWGILITTIIGFPLGVTARPQGFIPLPNLAEWAPVLGKLDVGAALGLGLLDIVFVFMFVDLFDTVGTLVGLAKEADFLDENGRLPQANRALLADSLGTIFGSLFGTQTVTTFLESAAGVAEGGRTGLTSLTVAVCFVLSAFFLPVIGIVPAAATASALILVGSMMSGGIRDIPWHDKSEAIPSFLAMVTMPFTSSIANGIAVGFISYPIVKAVTGKGGKVHWMVWALAVLFVLRFAYLGSA